MLITPYAGSITRKRAFVWRVRTMRPETMPIVTDTPAVGFSHHRSVSSRKLASRKNE